MQLSVTPTNLSKNLQIAALFCMLAKKEGPNVESAPVAPGVLSETI